MSAEARSANQARVSIHAEDIPVAGQKEISPLQLEVIELFVHAVKVLGLPKSVGEIYGLLFISPEAMPLDVIVTRLGISKGSASQGLRFLRNLGAVQPFQVTDDRREHFEAVTELKKLAAGFINGEINPHLESGTQRLEKIRKAAVADTSENGAFYRDRLARLGNWRRRGGLLLKIVSRFLGRTTKK